MSTIDPNWRWDGYRWWRWNGQAWVPELAASPLPPRQVSGYGPAPSATAQWLSPGVFVDKRDHSTQAVIAWILTVLTLGYFLPWAIAATRGKANSGAIGWLNFLLGWTLVGWIVALVMACGTHQIVAVGSNVTVVTPGGYSPGGQFPTAPPPSTPPTQPSWPAAPAPPNQWGNAAPQETTDRWEQPG